MKRFALGTMAFVGAAALALAGEQAGKTTARETTKVKLDNDKVRVIEYTSVPGGGVCGPGKHSHLGHVTYFLEPAKIKIVGADGKAATVDFKKDDVIWSPAETHTADNVGTIPSRLILVEVKK